MRSSVFNKAFWVRGLKAPLIKIIIPEGSDRINGEDSDQQTQKTHTQRYWVKVSKKIIYLYVTVATYNVTKCDMYDDYGNNELHQQSGLRQWLLYSVGSNNIPKQCLSTPNMYLTTFLSIAWHKINSSLWLWV